MVERGTEYSSSYGLTGEEAAKRLKKFGHNELPELDQRSLLALALSVIREPMILLLFASAGIYIVLGDGTEAALLLASALLVVGINIAQDVRSERALEALRTLTGARATVVRDGSPVFISARDVVPGDRLIVSEGDRIVADATLVEGRGIHVDESLLTGESLPVEKDATGDGETLQLRSGTLVVRGTAGAIVTSTGIATEIGKIGVSLSKIHEDATPLELQTRSLVRSAAMLSISFCLLTILLFRLTRGGWIEAALAGVALAMSLLPEEFPVILSVFLALGAKRLSASGILIRRLPAVEALGTVTVLCVDKTGTLTQNRMTLVETYTRSGMHTALERAVSTDKEFLSLLRVAAMASRKEGFDPMDHATRAAAKVLNVSIPFESPVQEISLTPELPVFTNIWLENDLHRATCKGAPEAILRLCRTSDADTERILALVKHMAERGLRILAVATGRAGTSATDLSAYEFQYDGLLGYADPLRESIQASVAECYEAGMRVIMITGDYPVTARTIAAQAGIRNSNEVLSGAQLEAMNSIELADCVDRVNIFARVTPSQKLEIVELLKERGDVVAMTGDGVNDAPALRTANVGVAMGKRGTDVAREAASVILTRDDFTSLVSAVRLGRRTYDNIKKAMYYVVAMHFPIAGLAILPLLLGTPLILYPIHIVLIELLLDPISSIVFEAEPAERTIMQRPPRNPHAPIFQRRNIIYASLQGISVLLVCTGVYLIAYERTHSEYEARTLTFATLLLANLALALINRSWTTVFLRMIRVRNPVSWLIIGSGVGILVLITEAPPLIHLFHFGPFHVHDWFICGLAAAASVTWFEILKLVSRKRLVV